MPPMARMNMSDISDEARTRAAMQLAEWMLLHLVNKGVIAREDAKWMLEQAIEKNFLGNDVHKQVAKLFEKLLSGIAPRKRPKAKRSTRG
jgi:hypothetical protein